jgi:hypothetical protein
MYWTHNNEVSRFSFLSLFINFTFVNDINFSFRLKSLSVMEKKEIISSKTEMKKKENIESDGREIKFTLVKKRVLYKQA